GRKSAAHSAKATYPDQGDTLALGTVASDAGRGVIRGSGDGTASFSGAVADGVNFADHRLTVTNDGAAVADLHLFGTFVSADFALSSDGQGGTEITLRPPDTLAMKG
ncbi:MAG TPA: hypothetical protein VJ770_16940, partial [Stellaceae bacterium]|nr:hypothetical protein [Stellaceae bacterium]